MAKVRVGSQYFERGTPIVPIRALELAVTVGRSALKALESDSFGKWCTGKTWPSIERGHRPLTGGKSLIASDGRGCWVVAGPMVPMPLLTALGNPGNLDPDFLSFAFRIAEIPTE